MRPGLAGRLEATLDRGRAMAEARMRDTFVIRRLTGVTYSKAEKKNVETYVDLFETKGRVKAASGLSARETAAGGRTIVSVSRELHIPVDSPPLALAGGDLYAFCTAVDPKTSDPTLLGARLKLAGPGPGSQTTARRLQVTEELT